jgi:hypothetical protein
MDDVTILNDWNPSEETLRRWAFDTTPLLSDQDEDLVLHRREYLPVLIPLGGKRTSNTARNGSWASFIHLKRPRGAMIGFRSKLLSRWLAPFVGAIVVMAMVVRMAKRPDVIGKEHLPIALTIGAIVGFCIGLSVLVLDPPPTI